jgi:hypothetical protein
MSALTSQAASLSALQQRMQDHVLSGDEAALADVRDSGAISAERRLGIYHHAYRARLLETMRDTFGHTLRYLGDEWFDHLARAFIECTPSASSNLRWYGRSWPQWLALQLNEASPMGSHPEVPELAELDWALRRAFDAADAPVMSLPHLAAMTPEDWATAVLPAQPSLQMLTLRCNTLSLWHALDDDTEVPQPETLSEPMSVLVWRHDERPHFRSMAAMEAYAVGLLTQGQSFADICAAMAEHFTDDDTTPVAGVLLRQWVEEGVLGSI